MTSIAMNQKSNNIVNLLKEVEGNALTLTQIAHLTGLSFQEVKAEVQRLVMNGSNIACHEGTVFLPSTPKKEFPTFVVLFATVLSAFAYIAIQHFIG